ncbi:MAG: MerC domain-containing protein [Paraglaciecola sp.]|uniref:MerC domain-containing protein n=1 Tax=Paraglaciecola sp. TaxID=1920173 RepID=UPI00326782FE
MFKKIVNIADRSAILLSTLCVVHCLLMPLILILLPTLTSLVFFSDERFHTWLLYAVIPISAFAIVLGYFHHRNWLVVLITSIGMAVLVLVAILGHDVFGERGEVFASVVGSIVVAYGHIINFKTRRQLS